MMTSSAATAKLPKQCLTKSFLDGLPEPFLGIARECIPPTTTESLLPAAERADLLEIHLRSQLLKLVHESILNGDATSLERVGKFWRSSLELCLHFVYFSGDEKDERYKGMSVRKLPLLLLEDALDALPLKSFQQVWGTIVEPAFDILFADILWHPTPKSTPCALPFIKLCNKFLRKLDVHKDDWPGRILLTLAKAFPLSDKSATKIWGSFHTENVTEFETETEFDTQQQQQQTSDSVQHPHHNKQLQTYSFYETFWSIQNDFSNPTGIKVADFLERMRTILAALESHPLIRSHTISLDGADGDNSSNNSQQQPPQVQYLTSSHLLPIQLGDPEFRIHFLTQFLIVENHLSSESPALGNMLSQLHKRAKDLMGRIQPHGHKHLQILEFLLQHREKYWRQWKKNKCQPDLETPFVKEEDEAATKKRRLMDGPLGSSPSEAPAAKKKKDEEELLIDFILHEKKDLKATCALAPDDTRSKVVPTLEEHLEPYVDALDPDAGIEAEYHPKNDSLFTWRALRLLSRNHLGKFHMINHKGDFEKMVRHIYAEEKGIQIPGEAPAAEEVAMEEDKEEPASKEEEEQEKEEVAKKEDDDDNNNGKNEEDEEMPDAEKKEEQESQKEDTEKEDTNTDKASEAPFQKGGENGEPKEEEVDKSKQSEKGTPVKEEASSKDKDENCNESPVAMDEDAPLDDDDDDAPLDDDDDDDEPRREKEEIESEDEGEIEESQGGKESGSPSRAPVESEKEAPRDLSPSRTEAPIKEDKKDMDRREEDRGDGGGRDRPQQQRRPGDYHGKGRPQHRPGGGGRGGHRNDGGPRDRNEPPQGHTRDRDRDHNRRGGRGGDGYQRSDDRRGGGYGPPGGGGGGRGGGRDDRRGGGGDWRDDRRGGGPPRRDDDRRGGGGRGGGDRRGDRRGGGRGDGRKYRR